jgi:hypothetical protein
MKISKAKISLLIVALSFIFTSAPQFAAENTVSPECILELRDDK